MKPRSSDQDPQDDLFKVRLSDLINPKHKLCRLSGLIDWDGVEADIEAYFSDQGAPGLPVRLMAGLMILQHTYGTSDEAAVDAWLESPYWQWFCGETFFQHEFPCHPTSLVKWRKRLGEAGCERLLSATVEAGLKGKVIKPSSFKRVVVDTTVQPKNVAYPTDAALYDKARKGVVEVAHAHGIVLRQTYDKVCRETRAKIGRYGHAKQYRRMRKGIKKVKNFLGRVYRDLLRQLPENSVLTEAQQTALDHAERLLRQQKNSKQKLYSLHAPEVECISKGKAYKRYEFGVKASFATTLNEGFVVGARSFEGNPYDGHTLSAQLEQVSILTDVEPEEAYVDRGYKGHQHDGDTQVFIAGQRRNITSKQKKRLNRRNAIEPIIGHMKSDGKLGRCFLKGAVGDALNVILCAVGQNIRKLLRWLYFALFSATFVGPYSPFCLLVRVILNSSPHDLTGSSNKEANFRIIQGRLIRLMPSLISFAASIAPMLSSSFFNA